jgi:multidrug transporter EmrE-like cation transporter
MNLTTSNRQQRQDLEEQTTSLLSSEIDSSTSSSILSPRVLNFSQSVQPTSSVMQSNFLKWIALISLILQNAGLAVVMRYTFLLATATGNRYIPSTAVLFAEIMKLLISFLACFYYDCNLSVENFISLVYKECYVNYKDFMKLLVPSILYTIQNSLQYFSMSCLSAPVFQVLYQMKIITTAVFSVIILTKRLSPMQWGSIMALTLGVVLVQLSQGRKHPIFLYFITQCYFLFLPLIFRSERIRWKVQQRSRIGQCSLRVYN